MSDWVLVIHYGIDYPEKCDLPAQVRVRDHNLDQLLDLKAVASGFLLLGSNTKDSYIRDRTYLFDNATDVLTAMSLVMGFATWVTRLEVEQTNIDHITPNTEDTLSVELPRSTQRTLLPWPIGEKDESSGN